MSLRLTTWRKLIAVTSWLYCLLFGHVTDTRLGPQCRVCGKTLFRDFDRWNFW